MSTDAQKRADLRHQAQEVHRTAEKHQHVQEHRKILMRKRMLRWVEPGSAYIPYIGDGDLAVELYRDFRIYGADIDSDRTAVAQSRLPAADICVADCQDPDSWPFPGVRDQIVLADFDAYAYPYDSFRGFWRNANLADRVLMFFTDGQGVNITFKGRWEDPAGHLVMAPGFEQGKSAGDTDFRREAWYFWFGKHVWPWFLSEIEPEWRVLDRFRYTRGAQMLYWGACVERV